MRQLQVKPLVNQLVCVALIGLLNCSSPCFASETDPTEPSMDIIKLLNAATQANGNTAATTAEAPLPQIDGYRLRAIVLHDEARGVAMIESPTGSRHRIVLRKTLPQQPVQLQIGEEILELVSFSPSQVLLKSSSGKLIMIGN